MTDIERRALLGDKQAQEECTEKGIVLPCPFCGGEAEHFSKKEDWLGVQFPTVGHLFYCKNCVVGTQYHKFRKEALTVWNTRSAPPIGRCFVELPCKVGDTVYRFNTLSNRIDEEIIEEFRIGKDYIKLMSDTFDGVICRADQIGKIENDLYYDSGYFLSKEEAEQALKGREKQ